MRAASLTFLFMGFGIGFGAMYPWMSRRAPEIAKPLPQFVPRSATEAPPPPDPAVLRQLEEVVKKDPMNFEALRELGNLQYDQENFEAAAAWYAKALAVRPDDVDVRADRGGALFRAGKTDEAIAELQKGLALKPTHPQSLWIYGITLFRGKDDPAKALESWKRLVETNPDFPDLAVVKEAIQQLENLGRRK